ncbi:MAG: PQQ-binding-like beta-propeller repeat protein [Elusimicrobiota bacterium]
MRKIILVFVGLVFIVLSVLYSVDEDSTVNQKSSIIYDNFCLIYEFHTDYIKLTSIGEFTSNYYDAFPVIPCGGGTFYSTKDVYDIMISENIKDCNIREGKINWRGASYETLDFDLIFKDTIEPDKRYYYIISRKVNRLPHLHKNRPIKKDDPLCMTFNISPQLFIKNNYRIVAIPNDSEYKGDTAYRPTEIVDLVGWRLLIYDVSQITTNIAAHPTFTIHTDSPELDIYEVFEKITNKKMDRLKMVAVTNIPTYNEFMENFFGNKEKEDNKQETTDYSFGVSKSKILPTSDKFFFPLGMLWKKTLVDSIVDRPVIKDGIVYFACRDELYKYDLYTGVCHWTCLLSDSICTRPVVTNEKIYIGCADYNLYVVDKQSGTVSWNFTTKGYVNSTPVVSRNKIYFCSFDGYLYSIDSSSGNLLWNKKIGGWHLDDKILPSVVIDKDILYSCSDNFVYAVDCYSGEIKWRFNTGARVNSSPAVGKNLLFVGNDKGLLCGINKKTGKQIWLVQYTSGIISDIVIYENFLYFITLDGYLYCIKLSPNENLCYEWWKYEIGYEINRNISPVVKSNCVITDSEKGLLFIHPTLGSLLWQYPQTSSCFCTLAADAPYVVYENNNSIWVLYSERE